MGVVLETIKFRLALWFKNHCSGSKDDLTILILDVSDRCVDISAAKVQRVVVPHPPFLDLSFYVDGSARGNPGEAGIGGILRDLRGRILCLFSFYVGVLDAFSAEVMAIHRACQLISGKSSVAWPAITIFSDSKSAMDCILGSDLVTCSWSANSSADCLAKAGSLSRGDRLEWGNV
ncbi:hypothetical protein Dsin_030553 [Dipteronia sinensis]|uniref:RNase H type-1 domain-containing protein n=1 Tax=Dipteronia sinensis TaxID=43782 RepID=A0AAD9ZJJ4_9ROSI|nr:hypothetical protein Dsin_030553 [Dipteronia sinensis]